MRLRVSDEDPLDELLGGRRVVAHDRDGSASVEIVITQTAHVLGGSRSMILQQRNNLAGREICILLCRSRVSSVKCGRVEWWEFLVVDDPPHSVDEEILR